MLKAQIIDHSLQSEQRQMELSLAILSVGIQPGYRMVKYVSVDTKGCKKKLSGYLEVEHGDTRVNLDVLVKSERRIQKPSCPELDSCD